MRRLWGWLSAAAFYVLASALLALCVVVALGPPVVLLWVAVHFIRKVW